MAITLLDYKNNIPIFQGFFLKDNNDKKESLQLNRSQKVKKINTEKMQPFTCDKSQKLVNAKPIPSITTFLNHKFRSGYIVRLLAKSQKIKNLVYQ